MFPSVNFLLEGGTGRSHAFDLPVEDGDDEETPGHVWRVVSSSEGPADIAGRVSDVRTNRETALLLVVDQRCLDVGQGHPGGPTCPAPPGRGIRGLPRQSNFVDLVKFKFNNNMY